MKVANNCTVVWRDWKDYKQWLIDIECFQQLARLKNRFILDNIRSVIEIQDKYEQRGDYIGLIFKDGNCAIYGHRRYIKGHETITVYKNLTLEQMHGKLIILNYVE